MRASSPLRVMIIVAVSAFPTLLAQAQTPWRRVRIS